MKVLRNVVSDHMKIWKKQLYSRTPRL